MHNNTPHDPWGDNNQHQSADTAQNYTSPPIYPPPVYPAYNVPPVNATPNNNAFVLGLISLISALICFGLLPIPLVLGILAILQANKANRLGFKTRNTKSGKIMGIIGIALGCISSVLYATYLVISNTDISELGLW